MRHFSKDIAAAIAIRTTGAIPNVHEIYEIAIVVLRPYTLEVDPNHLPFQLLLKPTHPEEADLPMTTLERLYKYGVPQDSAFDMLDTWFETLGMGKTYDWPHRNLLIPVCIDWVSIYNMLVGWSGYADNHRPNIDMYFRTEHYRDISANARFTSDVAGSNLQPLIFNHPTLSGICNKLDVVMNNVDSALNDALYVAECFKKQINLLNIK